MSMIFESQSAEVRTRSKIIIADLAILTSLTSPKKIAILHTCHQLRNEVAVIFFAVNSFWFIPLRQWCPTLVSAFGERSRFLLANVSAIQQLKIEFCIGCTLEESLNPHRHPLIPFAWLSVADVVYALRSVADVGIRPKHLILNFQFCGDQTTGENSKALVDCASDSKELVDSICRMNVRQSVTIFTNSLPLNRCCKDYLFPNMWWFGDG